MADSLGILFSRSSASPAQRFPHRLGMGFGDAEEGAGGAFGAAVALLPVLEGAGLMPMSAANWVWLSFSRRAELENPPL